jgi:hypothetical protein
VHVAGWILIVLGGLGTAGLVWDVVRRGIEEDRLGGIGMGLLVMAAGAALVCFT